MLGGSPVPESVSEDHGSSVSMNYYKKTITDYCPYSYSLLLRFILDPKII